MQRATGSAPSGILLSTAKQSTGLFCLDFARSFRSRKIGCRFSPRRAKRYATQRVVYLFGAPSGIRTPDTLLKRQVLYRLS